eukprot:3552131-Prymnesium_polylepis.1
MRYTVVFAAIESLHALHYPLLASPHHQRAVAPCMLAPDGVTTGEVHGEGGAYVVSCEPPART